MKEKFFKLDAEQCVNHILLLVLFISIFVFFNKPFIILPAVLAFFFNGFYILTLLLCKGWLGRCFAAMSLYANIYLLVLVSNSSMPEPPHYAEKMHWTFLGLDAVVVVWAMFWISFIALEILEISGFEEHMETRKKSCSQTEPAGNVNQEQLEEMRAEAVVRMVDLFISMDGSGNNEDI